jgi:hypothetical protein
MMDDGNARALTPLRKSSIAVLSPRLYFDCKPLGMSSRKGFLFAGAPAWQKMPSLVEIETDLIRACSACTCG